MARNLPTKTGSGARAGPRSARGSLVVGDGADHAYRLIYQACCLAGSTNLLEDLRDAETGLPAIVSRRDTPALFDWWVSALSYRPYQMPWPMSTCASASVTWRGLTRDLASSDQGVPSCKAIGITAAAGTTRAAAPVPSLTTSGAAPAPASPAQWAAQPDRLFPVPVHTRHCRKRPGRLVRQPTCRCGHRTGGRQAARNAQALIGPLRNVFGVSDKVLTMTLSAILISAPNTWPHWSAVGCSLIAVDTLVHNFMARTGILRRLGADHAYGAACYQPGRCAQIIEATAAKIDATKFNPTYPADFPRFVQHAIWRYCAQQGLDVCNGNRIDDRKKMREYPV